MSTFITQSEPETAAVGRQLAPELNAGAVILLFGDLGAGKTALVRGLAEGLGIAPGEVTSPTFALVHRYAAARSPVFHLDLYRLSSPAELTNLGWDEILAEEALILVEWPERAAERLSRNHVPISLQHLPDDPARRLLYAGGHQ